jgi:hypothetical protein
MARPAPCGRNRLNKRAMSINVTTKLKFFSLTALAVAAALATSAVAEEAAPQPSSDAKANNSPAHSPDALPAGNNSAPASGAASAEDIDTRITVQPHGPSSGKPGRVGTATNPIVPLKLINPHRRTFSPSRAANHFTPNPSGISGAQRQNMQPNPGERFGYNGVGQRPSISGPGGVSGGSPGLAKPGSTLGRQPAVQSTVISPVVKGVIRGGIGGPSANHRVVGAGTAGIGGPARTVTGINGTSIRETH